MPDTNRTPASASATAEEVAAAKPTKTRWLVLVLISFMYLITYMDRSNISVAAPAITEEFGAEQDRHGMGVQRVHPGLCIWAISGWMAGGPHWTAKSAHRHHVLVGDGGGIHGLRCRGSFLC